VTRASRAVLEPGATPASTPQPRAAERAEPAVPLLRVEDTGAAREARPGGRRFGSLVHASLAAVPLAAAAGEISDVVRAQARLLGATAEERAAAESAVATALRRAAEAQALRRETPALLRRNDGSLLEGVVDLAFREAGGTGAHWVVIDFKTDRELGEQRAVYAEQLRLYALAITAATGEPAEPILLSV
jgi:ATP-dependent exoDNAse (exonuclease V) beta subunit